MKPIMKPVRIAALILMFLFPILILHANASEEIVSDSPITEYTYPLNIDSPSWSSYTVLEKVELLKIPDSILKRMTDEALVQAIADFPYIGDIYAYGNSTSDGVATVATYCSALNELLSRKTGIQTLELYCSEIIDSTLSTASVESGYDRETFIGYVMLDILDTISSNYRGELSTEITTVDEYPEAPTTLNGTPLPDSDYDIGYEPHAPMATAHDNADQYYVETFGVTRIRKGSCVYNCHSYAWFDQSADNPFWIHDPKTFWEDHSYNRCYIGNVVTSIYDASIRNGDIVVYGPENDSTHSAIFSGNSNLTSTHSLATAQCISKWGQAGVFRHSLTSVPAGYIYSTIRIYR